MWPSEEVTTALMSGRFSKIALSFGMYFGIRVSSGNSVPLVP